MMNRRLFLSSGCETNPVFFATNSGEVYLAHSARQDAILAERCVFEKGRLTILPEIRILPMELFGYWVRREDIRKDGTAPPSNYTPCPKATRFDIYDYAENNVATVNRVGLARLLKMLRHTYRIGRTDGRDYYLECKTPEGGDFYILPISYETAP